MVHFVTSSYKLEFLQSILSKNIDNILEVMSVVTTLDYFIDSNRIEGSCDLVDWMIYQSQW